MDKGPWWVTRSLEDGGPCVASMDEKHGTTIEICGNFTPDEQLRYHNWLTGVLNNASGVRRVWQVEGEGEAPKPSEKQVGGDHYKKYKIQPDHFVFSNKIPYHEGSAIKYIVRHRDKGGADDIRKAIHFLELILEYEYTDEKAKL